MIVASRFLRVTVGLGSTSALRTSSVLVHDTGAAGHDGNVATTRVSLIDHHLFCYRDLHDTGEQNEDARNPRAGRVPTVVEH